MREILFRGKRVDINGKYVNNGEWVEGDFIRYSEAIGYITVDLLEHKTYEVDRKTLGECTGLTDKNGKLIFEGDIVKIDKATIKRFEGRYGVVKWLNDYASFALVFGHQWLFWNDHIFEENCEVIGNIYENPELIK